MTKTTHTARGTCQVCGSVQAIDNVSGLTAKHGYKVAGYGFFSGVCPGAMFPPAEKSLTVTHGIITQLEEAAVAHDAEAKGYRDRTILCTTYTEWDGNVVVRKRSSRGMVYQTTGDYVERAITPNTPAHIVNDAQTKAAAIAEQNGRHARSHVAMMREFIVPRLGQQFYPAQEVARAERKVAKAKAVEGVRFPTKQSRKDALDKLSRAYDKARKELQDLYLALPESDRTPAKTAIYYGPYQLNHWRAAHAQAAVCEFPTAASIVERIEALVKQREEIKNAK